MDGTEGLYFVGFKNGDLKIFNIKVLRFVENLQKTHKGFIQSVVVVGKVRYYRSDIFKKLNNALIYKVKVDCLIRVWK